MPFYGPAKGGSCWLPTPEDGRGSCKAHAGSILSAVAPIRLETADGMVQLVLGVHPVCIGLSPFSSQTNLHAYCCWVQRPAPVKPLSAVRVRLMIGNPIDEHLRVLIRAAAQRVLAFPGCATPPAWQISRPFVACPTCGPIRRGCLVARARIELAISYL